MKKLFVGDIKGYTDVYTDVDRIKIEKVDNKNTLRIIRYDLEDVLIPLAEIRDMILIKINSDTDIEELFRYEK